MRLRDLLALARLIPFFSFPYFASCSHPPSLQAPCLPTLPVVHPFPSSSAFFRSLSVFGRRSFCVNKYIYSLVRKLLDLVRWQQRGDTRLCSTKHWLEKSTQASCRYPHPERRDAAFLFQSDLRLVRKQFETFGVEGRGYMQRILYGHPRRYRIWSKFISSLKA